MAKGLRGGTDAAVAGWSRHSPPETMGSRLNTSLNSARRLAALAMLTAVLALLLAAPASAHGSATNRGASGAERAGTAAGSASGLQRDLVAGLPFTGLDLIAAGVGALALASMGLALRRPGVRQSSLS